MYNSLTYFYQDNKDAKKAERYIKMALKLDPENNEFKYLLALVYKNLGQVRKGQIILDELRANP